MASITNGRVERWGSGSFKIIDVPSSINGTIHYNPGLARDNKNTTYISLRSCITQDLKPLIYKGIKHPMHYINYLHVGKLNEETFEVTDIKEIKPEADYEGHQWGVEDVRLFWREDGLHGIGVALPVNDMGYGVVQHEILIDYEKGTYRLLHDFGNPKGVPEKNWSPTEHPDRLLDFAYSNSQTMLIDDGVPTLMGEEDTLQIHNGTPLLKLGSGFIQISHLPLTVEGYRTYVQVAILRNRQGVATHRSQFWVWGDGWREELQETIEFASGMLWHKTDPDTLLVAVGLKDELAGLTTLHIDKLNWTKIDVNDRWYNWRFV